ncbi:MAG: hypothetical protein DHS80DRAFT_23494 [Piptocephalis tieghemiana]|nr:MAG: hypothetical protein DHS80DRAFT_23494 [Piptocephalis tieghemiana]
MQALTRYSWMMGTLVVLLTSLSTTLTAAPVPGAPVPNGQAAAQAWSLQPSGFFFPTSSGTSRSASAKPSFNDAFVVSAAPIYGDPFFSSSYSIISDTVKPPSQWKFTQPITVGQIKKVTGITPSDAWIRAHMVSKK